MIMCARKIKKVFLILPPYTIPATMPKRVQPPLGIAYLGAYLERAGYEVMLHDSLIEGFDHAEVVYEDFIRYGSTDAQIREAISKFQPDVVGISCLFTIQAKSSYRICQIIKDLDPGIVTVMGGAHPSAMTEEVMAQGTVDFVIPAEGEMTFHQLLKALESGDDLDKVPGIVFNRDGKMFRTQPGEFLMELDKLPFPARHLLPMHEYFAKDRPHGTATRYKRSTPIMTSRGCPAKCTFCSIHTVWGREFRGRSGQNVLDELKLLVDQYQIKEIQIEDDNLTYSKPRAHEVLDKIIEADLGLSFTTPNGIAAWVLDKPLLEKLRKAGFYRLTIAVESGNQQVLHDIVKKPLQLKKVEEVVAMSKDLGFELDTFFVVGFPGETKEQIQDTFNFANKLNVDNAKFFIATPYPGTELYQTAKDNGFLNEGFDFHNGLSFTKAQISTPDFSSSDLEAMVAKASLKTQFNFMRRNPLQYLKSFFKDYFLKEPSAIFRYLFKSVQAALRKS